ncbi:MAG: DUF3108 domain-containing protein [Nitrospiraceae bacterium]|nr:MAG: DUF3108 domain-containing protein [Nitrospiraceae bacterium]
MRIFIVISLYLFSLISPFSAHSAETISSRFIKNFVYYVYWSGIRAGKAELQFELTPQEVTIRTRATSASFISLFYPVDDRSETVLYPNGYPKSSVVKINQGRHKRDKATYFEPWEKNKPQKVTYYNKLDEEKEEFTFNSPAYDPLSAFYAMTKMPLSIGTSEFIDIFDTKKVWHTEIQVLKKEKIHVQGKAFNTILIKPLLKSEGIFRKTGDILIWATDDDKKLPVMMKSKATIGTFTVELAEGDY